jgi:hypothetical protein
MQHPDERMAATVAAFEQWQAQRPYPKQVTPALLQQQAVALLAHFPSPQIVAKLNISGINLKRYPGQLPTDNQMTKFITLPQQADKPQARSCPFGLQRGRL